MTHRNRPKPKEPKSNFDALIEIFARKSTLPASFVIPQELLDLEVYVGFCNTALGEGTVVIETLEHLQMMLADPEDITSNTIAINNPVSPTNAVVSIFPTEERAHAYFTEDTEIRVIPTLLRNVIASAVLDRIGIVAIKENTPIIVDLDHVNSYFQASMPQAFKTINTNQITNVDKSRLNRFEYAAIKALMSKKDWCVRFDVASCTYNGELAHILGVTAKSNISKDELSSHLDELLRELAGINGSLLVSGRTAPPSIKQTSLN